MMVMIQIDDQNEIMVDQFDQLWDYYLIIEYFQGSLRFVV